MLDRSSEPFSVVAEYFGRGLFNKIVILKDDESQNVSAIDEVNLFFSSIIHKVQNNFLIYFSTSSLKNSMKPELIELKMF